MVWTLIYLWRGERHRGQDYTDFEEGTEALKAFRTNGFSAWLEPLR